MRESAPVARLERPGPAVRLWFRALAKLRFYRRLFLLERRLDAPIPDLRLPADVVVRKLGPGNVDAYAAFRPEHGSGECTRRLAEGRWCLATWRRGQIISTIWVASTCGWIAYLEQRIRLEAGEVYTYDLYTASAARGLGLTRASRVPQLRFLREEGYQRVLGSVSPDNAPAWALQNAVGFRRIGRIGYVGIGPWRRHFCRRMPERL